MKKYVFAVLAAGCLWGTMGFFTRTLATIGIDAEGAILVRCAMAALCFAVTILITNRAAFRVKPKDFCPCSHLIHPPFYLYSALLQTSVHSG